MTIQDDGLSFSVEVSQTVLGRAHLHYKNNFLSYAYQPPPEASSGILNNNEESRKETEDQGSNDSTRMIVEISLSALLNCLNIFGDSTVRPVSTKQLAARERWRTRQRDGREGGEERGGRYDFGDRDEDAEIEDREERAYANMGSTGNGKKKGTIAMVMTWEAEGCPLVLL